MTDYLKKKKEIFDTLSFAGHVVSEREHILLVLGGLGNDYDPVVVIVTSRVEPFSLKEVTSLLLTFEARLKKNNSVPESFSANFATGSTNDQNRRSYPQHN